MPHESTSRRDALDPSAEEAWQHTQTTFQDHQYICMQPTSENVKLHAVVAHNKLWTSRIRGSGSDTKLPAMFQTHTPKTSSCSAPFFSRNPSLSFEDHRSAGFSFQFSKFDAQQIRAREKINWARVVHFPQVFFWHPTLRFGLVPSFFLRIFLENCGGRGFLARNCNSFQRPTTSPPSWPISTTPPTPATPHSDSP